MANPPNSSSFSTASIISLAKWFSERALGRFLLVDLRSEWVLTGSQISPASEPCFPVAAAVILAPEALLVLRQKEAHEFADCPLKEANAPESAPAKWKWQSLSFGELGILFEDQVAPFRSVPTKNIDRIDELTGLADRGLLTSLLREAHQQFQASGAAFAVLFVDFDQFKPINDSQGHLAGDEVLRRAGQGILHAIRPGDRAIRFGGDEIVIIVRGLHSRDEALSVARRVRDAATKPLPWRGEQLQISASIGVAFSRSDDLSAEMLLERADQAMYRAKHRGRVGEIEVD